MICQGTLPQTIPMPAKGLDLLNQYVSENSFSWNAELCLKQNTHQFSSLFADWNVYIVQRNGCLLVFLLRHWGESVSGVESLSSLPVSIYHHFKPMDFCLFVMGLGRGWFVTCRKSVKGGNPKLTPLPLPHYLNKESKRWLILVINSSCWLLIAGDWDIKISDG